MPNAGEVIEITSYGVGGLPGGANTQIQFNNSNVFSGSPALTFNTTTSTLTASKYSGNGAGLSSIAGANVTGFVPNANVANTALAVSATSLPDVTSIGTLVSLDVTGNLSSGNANLGNLVIANFFSGNGNSISNIAGANVKGQVGNANIADQVYSSSQPNITSLGNLVSLTVAGTTTSQQTTETLIPITGAQGTVSHDFTSGALFVHTSMVSNFTVNVRYVPTTTNRTIVVVLILIQGSAPVVPSALQIDGAAQTINWANGITPSGYANKKDMVTFTLMRTGTSWTVFGQLATYG
jgi:hypothetical protein